MNIQNLGWSTAARPSAPPVVIPTAPTAKRRLRRRRRMRGSAIRAIHLDERIGEAVQSRYRPEDPPTWLGSIYSLVHRGEPDDAIDVLFDHLDRLLDSGDFEKCDGVLMTIDVKRLDTNLLVALASITRVAKDELAKRAQLMDRVETRLRELAPDRTDRLLANLR